MGTGMKSTASFKDTYDFLTSINLSSIRVHACKRYSGEQINPTKHSHETLEFCYFLKGRHLINVDNTATESGIYDLVGYAPRCEHQGSLIQNHETIILWLDIKYSTVPDNCMFQFNDKYGILRLLFEQIHTESQHKHAFSEEIINNYAQNIMYYIIRYYQSNASNSNEIKDILQYIAENYAWDITLEQLSTMMNISKPYLHRIFKKQTGMTPLQCLTETRIDAAKKYLSTTDMSIQEVTYLVGFDDSRYFSRVFKQVTGQTPSQWKKSAI